MSSLSVVVATQNTRDLVMACVQSVREADPTCEIVVVDDGGQDDTATALSRADLGITLVSLDRPQGFSRATNRGLQQTHGTTVLLLNSDTVIPDAASFAALDRAFAGDPRCGIVGASLRFPDGQAQWSGGQAPTAAWLFALASDLPRRFARPPSGHRGGAVEWVTGAALGVRREVLERVGLLDEAFACYGQDVEFCLRVAADGWRICIEPEFAVVHIGGATIGDHGHKLAWLWADLVRVVRRHRGPAAAWRAVAALSAGALVRTLIGQPRGVGAALAAARRAAGEPGSGTIPHLPASSS